MPDGVHRNDFSDVAVVVQDVDAAVLLANLACVAQVQLQHSSQQDSIDHVVRQDQDVLTGMTAHDLVECRLGTLLQVEIRLPSGMLYPGGVSQESFTQLRITLLNLIPGEAGPLTNVAFAKVVDGVNLQGTGPGDFCDSLLSTLHRAGVNGSQLDVAHTLGEGRRLLAAMVREWPIDFAALQDERTTLIGLGGAVTNEEDATDRGCGRSIKGTADQGTQTHLPLGIANR